jgi:hypothetical protein
MAVNSKCARSSARAESYNGLGFAAIGSQEQNPRALALACIARLKIETFLDVEAHRLLHVAFEIAAPGLLAVLFEPFEPNCKLIKETLIWYALPDLELVSSGVSDQSGIGMPLPMASQALRHH